MTTANTPEQQEVLNAVQKVLTDFSESVRTAHLQLRNELAAERAEREALEAKYQQLSNIMGRQQELDDRIGRLDDRLNRVVDDANVGAVTAAEQAIVPATKSIADRQDRLGTDVADLSSRLTQFDEQAALMVRHFGDITTELGGRLDEVAVAASNDVDARMGSVERRVDEFSSSLAQRDTETKTMVSKRVDDAEDRLNERLMAMEVRSTEEVGKRVAEIDAFVGRMSSGLDESVGLLSDRISKVDEKFGGFEGSIGELAAGLKALDVEAVDELKEKVASAAGEAMLVRIEMERFQETIGESVDKTAVRLTEVETQLQDQAMDTETAVQLERLEEVERALIALDPAQFVRVADGQGAPGNAGESDVAAASVPTVQQAPSMDAEMTPPNLPLSHPSEAPTSAPMGSFAAPSASAQQ